MALSEEGCQTASSSGSGARKKRFRVLGVAVLLAKILLWHANEQKIEASAEAFDPETCNWEP